jgi:tRNA(fMet)-specific endonuclease VapC
MAVIVADTDVLIDFLENRAAVGGRVASELAAGGLCTTVISRFELLSGARNPRQETSVRRLLPAVPALVLDNAAADRAAQVRRSLDAAGEGIGMADSLIAGIVLTRGASLLTRNVRHFARVRGLDLAS